MTPSKFALSHVYWADRTLNSTVRLLITSPFFLDVMDRMTDTPLLKSRMKVIEYMSLASFHYADDSDKEWFQAAQYNKKTAEIMSTNRWSANNIMKIHALASLIYPVEDSLNGVIQLLYSEIYIVKRR